MKKQFTILVVSAVGLMLGCGSLVFAQEAGDEANKKILKDALLGAITGSVAAEATRTDTVQSQSAESNKDKALEKSEKKAKGSGSFPPGWSKGKKTGWEGADTPPGFEKGEKKGWDDKSMPPGLSGESDKGHVSKGKK